MEHDHRTGDLVVQGSYTLVQLPTDSTVYYLSAVRDGDDYNLGVRTRGAGGARSTWATLTHTVVGKTDAPTAPTTLGVTPAAGGFDIAWDACPDADYWATEIYEASSNDRTTATKIAEVVGIRMARSGLAGGLTRYYWIRNLDTTGNISTWYPTSATGGVSATTASAGDGKQITHDTTSYLAGGATGYLTGLRWLDKDQILPKEPSTALITSLFNEGKAAMVFSGPWFLGEIAKGVDFGLARLPTIDEAGGKPMRPWMTVEGVYVAAPSQQKDAAFDLVKYLTDVDAARVLALEGRQSPANAKVYADSKVASDPVLKAFRTQVETALPMPNLPEMTMVWSPATTAMNQIIRPGRARG